jgi:hypothetical protein
VGEVLVLCYHAVSEKFPASLSVSPGTLRDQLGIVVRRGYQGATFQSALSEPRDGKTVAVTFDDAYRSVITLALPILAEYGPYRLGTTLGRFDAEYNYWRTLQSRFRNAGRHLDAKKGLPPLESVVGGTR